MLRQESRERRARLRPEPRGELVEDRVMPRCSRLDPVIVPNLDVLVVNQGLQNEDKSIDPTSIVVSIANEDASAKHLNC